MDINKEHLSRFDLSNRVALVTGAAGHLGSSISQGLAQAGATVLLNGRSKEKLEALHNKLISQGLKTEVCCFDIENADAVKDNIIKIKENFGKIDILINNAYFGAGGSLGLSKDDFFTESYNIAVTAAARLIREAYDLMKTAASNNIGGSSIINISSMYGIVSPDFRLYDSPESYNPPFYGAAKAALLQLTRYCACQFAQDKIRVNSVSPGPFPSNKVQEDDPNFCNRLIKKVPLMRLGAPQDLIGPIVFLSSDASAFVTGANICIDGGWTAW
jgi:NAD(P)-dependent dehydrogenase (short-subunit alcohol dehydrogenase family)